MELEPIEFWDLYTVKNFVYMLHKNLCEKLATYFPQNFA